MPAVKFNLTHDYRIEQGSTFEMKITVKNADGSLFDLSAASCAAQIREEYSSSIAVSFTTAINTTTSVITLTLSATVTAAITFASGYWDCELTIGTTVTRLLYGSVTISKEVTKA